jgi:hypothetical protein
MINTLECVMMVYPMPSSCTTGNRCRQVVNTNRMTDHNRLVQG